MLRAIQKLQLPGALEADRVPELYNLLYLQYRQSDEEDREDFKSHIWLVYFTLHMVEPTLTVL